MDPDLALSPYPLSDRRDPDDEVREIFERLRHTTYLNPTVEDFLEDPRQKDLFLEVFARQANLIKSRCQSFDDCHVTVYDKVLLLLTDNGNIFESAAAQEYFCEEFLGINKDGNPIEVNEILQQNVVLKAILAKGKGQVPNMPPCRGFLIGFSPVPPSCISPGQIRREILC